MAVSKIQHARIAGICSALPDNSIPVTEIGQGFFKEKEVKKISASVGVSRLYRAKEGQTASDLCYHAALKLIKDLGWEKNSIDGLVFVSQTPDYITPSTACILQHRLGLSRDCVALDINLGCSGYVYGLWQASQMIFTNTCKRVLLLVGDTLSKRLSMKDKSVALLFSDGASATAVEYTEQDLRSTFVLCADGAKANALIMPAGGFRNPADSNSSILVEDQNGNFRSEEHFLMDGMEVFLFTMREVGPAIERAAKIHGFEIEKVDGFLLHQANRYMLKSIARQVGMPIEKMPINIDKYGNTSGASIPILICDCLKEELKHKKMEVILAGFGVGLSWGAAALSLENVCCCDLLYI